jgi:hypothetical protein
MKLKLDLVCGWLRVANLVVRLVIAIEVLRSMLFNYFQRLLMAMTPLWDHRFELSPTQWVFVPSTAARERGIAIRSEIARCWIAPSFYYHLARGGHLKASKVHLNARFFASVDLKGFFNSINRSRVTRALKPYFGYAVARTMAKDSVVLLPGPIAQYILPFGFVQSPLIASLCLDVSRLGRCLRLLHANPQLRVSVYMDDIIISCDDIDQLHTAYSSVLESANRSGWLIHPVKTSPPARNINIFNLDVSTFSLVVSDERMHHFADAYKTAMKDSQRLGIVNYIKAVNPAQAQLFFDAMQ